MIFGMGLWSLVHQEGLILQSRVEKDGWGCSGSPKNSEELQRDQQFPVPHPKTGWGRVTDGIFGSSSSSRQSSVTRGTIKLWLWDGRGATNSFKTGLAKPRDGESGGCY